MYADRLCLCPSMNNAGMLQQEEISTLTPTPANKHTEKKKDNMDPPSKAA